jgi:transcriptional regulator with XRE-family HTH domain
VRYRTAPIPGGKDIGDGRQNAAVSIGEVLAEARHRRGFTVAEVSHYARVRESIIRAIEQDDYLLSGSDSHARSDIRAIAVALGLDPSPLIGEFDATHGAAPAVSGVDAVRSTLPLRRSERDGSFGPIERRRIRWVPVLAVLVLAAGGFAAYHFIFGPGSSGAAVSGRTSPGQPAGTSRPAAPASSAAPALIPARVRAFGPGGTADGDNPQLAPRAIDRNPATAWTTDRYATPLFGSTRPGTGLLLDMGKVVTITGAEVTLGSVPGASFQMRAGNTPSRAELPVVAIATNASGVLGVRLTAPVHARYVLIWFTKLPPWVSGTFQARVYNITVQGTG